MAVAMHLSSLGFNICFFLSELDGKLIEWKEWMVLILSKRHEEKKSNTYGRNVQILKIRLSLED